MAAAQHQPSLLDAFRSELAARLSDGAGHLGLADAASLLGGSASPAAATLLQACSPLVAPYGLCSLLEDAAPSLPARVCILTSWFNSRNGHALASDVPSE